MFELNDVIPARTIRDVMCCLAPSQPEWSEIKKWPPNVFALTSILLAESGAYRLAASPPGRKSWPGIADFWEERLFNIAASLRVFAAGKGQAPRLFQRYWRVLEKAGSMAVPELANPDRWDVCEAVLYLHAMADQACQGVGVPTGWPMSTPEELAFSYRAYYLLSRRGTLANINPNLIRVLPKLHTPQTGITIRSLSHHLTVSTSEVMINWQLVHYGLRPDRETINIMAIPIPYEVKPTDFRPWRNTPFFSYAPTEHLDTDEIIELIAMGRKSVGPIDMVVFPEASLSCDDMERLLDRIKGNKNAPIILAGVRKPPSARKHGSNFAEFVVRIPGQQPYRRRQFKHHRWCMDDTQIRQYHLGSTLDPNYRWWEAISIEKRELNFFPLTDAITVCPLICEDLARQEPVAEVVRAVGPTLIIALLLDGPQMSARWPSRYATVFADDPGSSVLTLTSLGMALRSTPPGKSVSRLVALWKDKKTGLQEISLLPGKEAVILSVCREWEEEWTVDRRSDGGSAAIPFLAGIEQIGH